MAGYKKKRKKRDICPYSKQNNTYTGPLGGCCVEEPVPVCPELLDSDWLLEDTPSSVLSSLAVPLAVPLAELVLLSSDWLASILLPSVLLAELVLVPM